MATTFGTSGLSAPRRQGMAPGYAAGNQGVSRQPTQGAGQPLGAVPQKLAPGKAPMLGTRPNNGMQQASGGGAAPTGLGGGYNVGTSTYGTGGGIQYGLPTQPAYQQTAIDPSASLVGQQFTPQQSGYTNWTQGQAQQAGNQYGNFQFGDFQSMGPLDFTAERGMLTGANDAMQGLGYDWGGANGQYTGAMGQLAGAAGRAGSALQGLQGLGAGSFSGGGANTADFGRAQNLWGQARDVIGDAFQYAGDTGQARSYVIPALDKAMTGPERNQLAAESLSLLEERSNPAYQQNVRGLVEQNAAMGRRGSGLLTSGLADLGAQREQELAWARRDLANDAAGKTLQDRADRTNLALGVTQGLGGEDRSAQAARDAQAQAIAKLGESEAGASMFNAGQMENAAQRSASGAQFGANFQRGVAGDLYGMGRDQAGMAFDFGDRLSGQERDRIGLGQNQADFQRGVGNDLAGLTDRTWNAGQSERNAARADQYNQFGAYGQRFNDFGNAMTRGQAEDRMVRDEMRGERDYQYGLSRDAVNDEYARMDFEERLRNGRFNRATQTANMGFGASPTGMYQDQAAQAGAQAGDYYGAMGSVMSQLGSARRRGRRSGGGAGQAPATYNGLQ